MVGENQPGQGFVNPLVSLRRYYPDQVHGV